MQKHKTNDTRHDYCPRCDEDFGNEESLLIHKIKSTKHIVCPICGEEFRSEGGRDVHLRQIHPADQDITCPGPTCGKNFRRAFALLAHIEKGECKDISVVRLAREQAKKVVIKHALALGPGPSGPGKTNSTDTEGFTGGVSVVKALQEYSNKEAMMNQPQTEDSDVFSAAVSLKHWPRLSEKRAAEERSDLMTFSQVSAVQSENRKPTASTVRSAVSQDDNLGSQDRLPAVGSFGQGLPDAGQTLQVLTANWDPNKYFNSYIGCYDCFCGLQFHDRDEFERHVLRKWGGTGKATCPGCSRIFKTTAALVAHCESASTRCRVSDGENYAQIIDEISGGFVQSVGYHDDGTMKYEAGNIVIENKGKVVIGRDISDDW
ncbi:hypothetical protein V8E54_003058 [Elaphomyces granulatus]